MKPCVSYSPYWNLHVVVVNISQKVLCLRDRKMWAEIASAHEKSAFQSVLLKMFNRLINNISLISLSSIIWIFLFVELGSPVDNVKPIYSAAPKRSRQAKPSNDCQDAVRKIRYVTKSKQTLCLHAHRRGVSRQIRWWLLKLCCSAEAYHSWLPWVSWKSYFHCDFAETAFGNETHTCFDRNVLWVMWMIFARGDN